MEQKNKGGRPRSSRVQKKSRAVTIRYSALQYDIVRHRARTAGFHTLTEYVREASVNAEVVQNFIKEHNAVFRNLSGLCNNLNQLTRLPTHKAYNRPKVPCPTSFPKSCTSSLTFTKR